MTDCHLLLALLVNILLLLSLLQPLSHHILECISHQSLKRLQLWVSHHLHHHRFQQQWVHLEGSAFRVLFLLRRLHHLERTHVIRRCQMEESSKWLPTITGCSNSSSSCLHRHPLYLPLLLRLRLLHQNKTLEEVVPPLWNLFLNDLLSSKFHLPFSLSYSSLSFSHPFSPSFQLSFLQLILLYFLVFPSLASFHIFQFLGAKETTLVCGAIGEIVLVVSTHI